MEKWIVNLNALRSGEEKSPVYHTVQGVIAMESIDSFERTVEVSRMQQLQQNQSVAAVSALHPRVSSTVAVSMDRHPYNTAALYQTIPYPQFYPQLVPHEHQHANERRADKVVKDTSNYQLQNVPTTPTSTTQGPVSPPGVHHLNATDDEEGNAGAEVSLKMKGTNGKLAIPDILRAKGVSDIDLSSLTTHQRAKREFVPDNKKDSCYWSKRVKNNDSARRSRVKRKTLEKIMENRLMELQRENIELRHEMNALKRRFGVEIEIDRTQPQPQSYAELSASLECNLDDPSSPPEKHNEEMDHSSDDSRSLDDSRSSYIRSASALSASLEPANRERADSLGSNGSSSSSVQRSPSSNSPPANWEYSHFVKTDKSGALDLTNNDFSGRSLPNAKNCSVHKYGELDSQSVDRIDREDTKDVNMRAFPLKCRWKLSASSKSSTTDNCGSSSFPGY